MLVSLTQFFVGFDVEGFYKRMCAVLLRGSIDRRTDGQTLHYFSYRRRNMYIGLFYTIKMW